LLLLNWSVPLTPFWAGPGLGAIAQGIGAGVYEELVFRLGLISLLMIVFADLLRLHRGTTAVAAVCVSAVLFAAHHHVPFGQEAFHWARFAFRTVAGVYLAVMFWYRGYALAAGCHATYNSSLVLLNIIRPG
jgi:membrane protease YdiL (CAAX protease family)